ncbi:MAG TPA: undecaprenyldiphospho-muramoylpentapeptide beta-N-acetylglucosaminyltransferase [Syntrophomonadaceae bacterium]|nr:undecaprenyldiphospho-muramoylpentapeptide beta-N-acetylglucosaminyltransferase [Syntrophomonadaceae bacterium]
MRLILSGGGTGGHVYPALAIAQGVKDVIPSVEILYIGTQKGMESIIVPKAGYDFKYIDISGIDRSSMVRASKSLIKFPKSFFTSLNIIRSFKPDVVVGTGGYVSFSPVMAATFLDCKSIIHEQNALMGLANRNLAKRVDHTLLTFEEAAEGLEAKDITITGLPVRQEIMQANRNEAKKELGLDNRFTLVAFGGSRGAASINRGMLGLIDRYRKVPNLQIIWITGENNYTEIKDKIQSQIGLENLQCKLLLYPYMFNIENALVAADLAVCRAGASTVAELSILGLPAILVPYPYATDGHQEKNAKTLLEKKAADMVIDEFLDGDTLYKKVEYYRNNINELDHMKQNLLKEAKPNALRDIVDIIMK